MSLEDRLDALLTVSGQPISPLPEDDDARALAPLLTAARRLAPLREARPSAGFADQLERQILAHAARHAANAAAPASAQVPGDAAGTMDGDAPTVQSLIPNGTATSNGDAPTWPATMAPRRPRSSRLGTPVPLRRRGAALPVWARALAAACVLLVLSSGLFAAAANAQPGSPLFGLHQAEQWAQVALASPAGRAQLHLQYAGNALAALDHAVAQHSGDPAYSGALDTLRAELAATATAIAALPAGQTHDALAAQLATLQRRTRADLRAALPGLGWDDRVATTTALGGLGERVPRITSAAIHEIAGQGAQVASHGTHNVEIVVSGGGFAAGARLVINGQPAGTVLSISNGTLVAQVSLNPSAAHIVSIGVENPDGTAAQMTDVGHGAAVTATPAPTHHGHGGH